jgi:hypothetical protein
MFRKKKSKEQEFQEALAELRALPRPAHDMTTPEGAILCLEDAMRRRDLEAAVACKDFQVEAVVLLVQTMPDCVGDETLQAEAAMTLELGYRKELSDNWPNMEGVESFFVEQQRDPAFEDLSMRLVTELTLMPDGTLSQTIMRVAKRHETWRVIHPVSDDAAG